MRERKPGSVGLSIVLTILIILSGTIFINSISARKVLEPDSIRSVIEAQDIQTAIETKLNSLEIAQYIDLSNQVEEMVSSQSFDDLLDQYAEFLSEYLLTGSTEKEITEQELTDFITPFILQWTEDTMISLLPQEQVENFVKTSVAGMELSSVFISLDDYIPEEQLNLIHTALSITTQNVSMILTIVLLFLLVWAARPRRFAVFAGGALLLTGGISLLGGKIIRTYLTEQYNHEILSLLLTDFMNYIKNLSIPVIIAGGILLIAGIILAKVTRHSA